MGVNADGVEDLSTLTELNTQAIMHNLYLRYHKDLIYVRYTHTNKHPSPSLDIVSKSKSMARIKI